MENGKINILICHKTGMMMMKIFEKLATMSILPSNII
jgi:hypothetical protein